MPVDAIDVLCRLFPDFRPIFLFQKKKLVLSATRVAVCSVVEVFVGAPLQHSFPFPFSRIRMMKVKPSVLDIPPATRSNQGFRTSRFLG